MQVTVFIVSENGEPVGARLTLAAAISLCKEAPGRSWKKLIATKEHGSSRFDINAKQQEKQHGPSNDQSAHRLDVRLE